MRKVVKLAVPWSILAVACNKAVDVPSGIDVRKLNATPSCIVVPTLPEVDGETEIGLSDSIENISGSQVFNGLLDTPDGVVGLWTAQWDQLLSMNVVASQTRIRIWTNAPDAPDKVDIVIS